MSGNTWAYVSSDFPAQDYYDTSSALQVGVEPGTGTTSYAFYTMPLPSRVKGTTINSATVYFPEVWSDSCTASPVDLYQTGGISSSTTYDNQPSWGAKLGSDNVAYGWSSTGEVGGSSNCPYSAKDVSYNITSTIASDAAGTLPSSLTFGLKAEDTSDSTGWKQFADPKFSAVPQNATITITYAATPAKPVLSTSPAADCSAGTTVLGDGDVLLKAAVSDTDGGTLTVAYAAYADGKTGDTFASNPTMSVSAGSGTTAQLELAVKDLEHAASEYGSGGAVTITWSATVSTGLSGVPTASANCSFVFSDATPGAPIVTDSGGNPGCDTLSYVVGTPATFTVSADDGTVTPGTKPLSYSYQLNGGDPVTVSASTTSPYSATLKVTPTRITNVLDVTATGAGGNLGQTFPCVINAAPPGPATDQDMTGDSIPDLLTVGTGTTGGTTPGMWLASGQGSDGRFDGTVTTTPTDIAPNGPQDTGTPASWNGLQAVTGQFTGPGFNDIEAYQPGTGNIYLLAGSGDGSAATSQDQNLTTALGDEPSISSNDCANGSASSYSYPQQLVNAYNVSGDNEPYPDQIGLFSGTAGGQYLAYFANSDAVNSFDSGNLLGLPYELTNTSPDGTMDWADWTITTDSDTRNGTTDTDMWLRNQSTGALYLWELAGLTGQTPGTSTFDPSTGTLTCTNPSAVLVLASAQTEVSSSWNEGTSLATFQATDVNGDPGLVTVTDAGQVQSWQWNGTSLTQANATGSAQALQFATHEWKLDDGTSGTASTAADTGTGTHLSLTGNSGVTWTTDDVLGAAADFNGTTGDMTASSQVLNTTGNWSVSAWVKPDALGGIVLSEYGTEASCLRISIATTTTSGITTGSWRVGTTSADTATATSVLATAGETYNVQIGTWTHLTATYDASAGFLRLYVDGIPAADVTTTSTWSSGCNTFALGQWKNTGDDIGGYFNGEIADVQAWNGTVLTPTQAAALSGTPGSYVLFPSNSQQFTSASSPTTWQWSSVGAEMNFYQGVLTIQDTGTGTSTASFGTSGNPDAVLTLQTDGNLVIYPNAASATAADGDAIWKSATGGDTGDVMILQPDGNLVIYGSYSQVLWASDTAN